MDLGSLLEGVLGGGGKFGSALWENLSGGQKHLLDQLSQFTSRLGSIAMTRWQVNILNPHECEIEDCQNVGLTQCKLCGGWTCLAHGHVSHRGELVCDACVDEVVEERRVERPKKRKASKGAGWGEAPWEKLWEQYQKATQSSGQKAPPGPAPKDPRVIVEKALESLDLDEEATWDEIQKQYRRLAVKHHPDRAKNDASRKKAEIRMREINAAYEVLRAVHESRAA